MSSCVEDEDLSSLPYARPDVVLVRKSFADKDRGRKKRDERGDAQSVMAFATAAAPEDAGGAGGELEEFALPDEEERVEELNFFDIDEIDKTDDWNIATSGSDSDDGELADSSFSGFAEISEA